MVRVHAKLLYYFAVLFWCMTAIRYLLAALMATVISLTLAFFFIEKIVADPKDDSPGLGIAWIGVAVVCAILLVPISLGATAEWIERKQQARSFRLWKALARTLLVMPIVAAPFYAWAIRASFLKQILLYAVAIVLAFLALRIQRRAVAEAHT